MIEHKNSRGCLLFFMYNQYIVTSYILHAFVITHPKPPSTVHQNHHI